MNVEFNQKLVDSFFNNWVGIHASNTEDYNIGPSALLLYFPDFKSANRAYVFLKEWNVWLQNRNIKLSIVKESEERYSFYFFIEGRPEFVKGSFQDNLNIGDLAVFLRNENDRKFVIMARYPNGEEIFDNISQDVFLLKGFKFIERENVRDTDIENK